MVVLDNGHVVHTGAMADLLADSARTEALLGVATVEGAAAGRPAPAGRPAATPTPTPPTEEADPR